MLALCHMSRSLRESLGADQRTLAQTSERLIAPRLFGNDRMATSCPRHLSPLGRLNPLCHSLLVCTALRFPQPRGFRLPDQNAQNEES